MTWLGRLRWGGRSRPSMGMADQPGRPVYSVGEHGAEPLSSEEVAALRAALRRPPRWVAEHGPELVNVPPGYRVSTPEECAAGWAPLTIRPVRPDRPPVAPPPPGGWPRRRGWFRP